MRSHRRKGVHLASERIREDFLKEVSCMARGKQQTVTLQKCMYWETRRIHKGGDRQQRSLASTLVLELLII